MTHTKATVWEAPLKQNMKQGLCEPSSTPYHSVCVNFSVNPPSLPLSKKGVKTKSYFNRKYVCASVSRKCQQLYYYILIHKNIFQDLHSCRAKRAINAWGMNKLDQRLFERFLKIPPPQVTFVKADLVKPHQGALSTKTYVVANTDNFSSEFCML